MCPKSIRPCFQSCKAARVAVMSVLSCASSDTKEGLPGAGATYYFDIFARKYIQSLGIEPKPAKKVE